MTAPSASAASRSAPSSAPAAYARLERAFHEAALLDEAAAILHWDMSTVMPAGGAASRADQLAWLRVLSHRALSAPDLAALFAEAEGEAARLSERQRANLREMARRRAHAAAVPDDLVDALSQAASRTEMLWRTARPAADFPAVRGALAQLLTLVREQAAIKAEALGLTPYDALLDQYEPGGRQAAIDPVFRDLASFLPGFIDDALAAQAARDATRPPPALLGPFPLARQKDLARIFMTALGFDFARGRLDETFHPFCGGTPDDVRVTARYRDDDFAEGLMAVLHETGHALYEQGLPEDWRRRPAGQARGMSVHESQSLFIEMQLCRSRAFFDYAAPLIRDAFGGGGPAYTAAALYARAIRVERGFIRVEADEATYPAHVIARTRLEQAMVAGDLAVADLPGAWNDAMKDLLGMVPPDDRLGCLQDIHWYGGDFGYFPTYTLGAMMAAQLAEALRRDQDDLDAHVAAGNFAPIVAWLRTRVHRHASFYETPDLLVRATGRPLDAGAFKAHLRARYLAG